MTLVGNRIEWVLSLLACWRMGAVALPCSTQLRRHDLELRVAAADPKLCVGEDSLLAELPDGVATMTMDEVAAVARRGPAAGDAGAGRSDGRRGSGADRLHLRHHRRAAGRRARLPLPARTAGPGRALVRLAQGRAGLVHDRDRLVEVGPQRLPRPLADRGRRGHPRRSLRPGRAARLRRGARRQRALPGADRVPDAGQAHRPAPAPRPAPHGLRRRAARGGDDRRLRARRPGSSPPTATARPRPATSAATSSASRSARARWASRCPAWSRRPQDRRAASCSCAPPPPPPSSRATSTASASRASGGRPATWSAKTRTATSSSRAATTTSSSPPATGSAPSRSSPPCSPTRPSPRPPPSPPPTPSAAPSCGRSSSPASASRARSWPASCRSTASARPPPTSSPASSSSPTSCRRRAAARSSGRSCARVGRSPDRNGKGDGCPSPKHSSEAPAERFGEGHPSPPLRFDHGADRPPSGSRR